MTAELYAITRLPSGRVERSCIASELTDDEARRLLAHWERLQRGGNVAPEITGFEIAKCDRQPFGLLPTVTGHESTEGENDKHGREARAPPAAFVGRCTPVSSVDFEPSN